MYFIDVHLLVVT